MRRDSRQGSLARVLAAGIVVRGLCLAASPARAQDTTGANTTRQTPPPGGPPRNFALPPRQNLQLDNGMQVTLVHYGLVPKVNVLLVLRSGNVDEAADQIWLADLTGQMLKEGTTTRSATQIAEQAAGMGGSVDVSVSPDQTFISGEALSEFGPRMIALLGDVVEHPAFPASQLARHRADLQRQLSIQTSQPQATTAAEFNKLLYPDHPYGRWFPTNAMLGSYTMDQVRGFYQQQYGAGRAHLYVVGVFDGDSVQQAVRTAFSGWAPGPAAVGNVPKPVTERRIILIDRPGAPQSTIYLGLPVADPSSPDYMALVVTNALLGGAFSSRITADIREAKGYTYSPFSTIATRYHTAYWAEVADVTTADTGPAIGEIFKQVDSLRAAPPSPQELAGTQNYLAGIFVLRNSSRQGIIGQLAFMQLHGLGDDYLTQYVDHVHAVTPEQVQEMAKKYLDPQQMLLVVTGDRTKILKQLQAFGPVRAAP
jgi:zinc protease